MRVHKHNDNNDNRSSYFNNNKRIYLFNYKVLLLLSYIKFAINNLTVLQLV